MTEKNGTSSKGLDDTEVVKIDDNTESEGQVIQQDGGTGQDSTVIYKTEVGESSKTGLADTQNTNEMASLEDDPNNAKQSVKKKEDDVDSKQVVNSYPSDDEVERVLEFKETPRQNLNTIKEVDQEQNPTLSNIENQEESKGNSAGFKPVHSNPYG